MATRSLFGYHGNRQRHQRFSVVAIATGSLYVHYGYRWHHYHDNHGVAKRLFTNFLINPQPIGIFQYWAWIQMWITFQTRDLWFKSPLKLVIYCNNHIPQINPIFSLNFLLDFLCELFWGSFCRLFSHFGDSNYDLWYVIWTTREKEICDSITNQLNQLSWFVPIDGIFMSKSWKY